MQTHLRRPLFVLAVAVLLSSVALPFAAAAGDGPWTRPVPGPVVRPFDPPRTRYGAGHLGADLAAAPGTPVRTAGAGTIEFAGVVAGTRHVVVRHAGGLRTSYAFLQSVAVRRGQAVGRGEVVGRSGGTGRNHDGHTLHLGLRVRDAYVDPMQLFAPADLSRLVRLAPVVSAGSGPG